MPSGLIRRAIAADIRSIGKAVRQRYRHLTRCQVQCPQFIVWHFGEIGRHRPYVLGAILSRMTTDDAVDSGYKLAGPGCGDPESGVKKSIMAHYPRPLCLDGLECTSLDYSTEELQEYRDT